LRSLRSLLVEIHPPDLGATGLSAALEDLVAPAASRGIAVSVVVEDVTGVSEATLALVWRVAQEAVRNTIRHAGATRLELGVLRSADLVVLEVRDDGTGFLLGERQDPTSFGLRGLQSLAADHGGRLEVRSLPGSGTTVRLEVGAK
jgi:two-component system NarL family sensor kinase